MRRAAFLSAVFAALMGACSPAAGLDGNLPDPGCILTPEVGDTVVVVDTTRGTTVSVGDSIPLVARAYLVSAVRNCTATFGSEVPANVAWYSLDTLVVVVRNTGWVLGKRSGTTSVLASRNDPDSFPEIVLIRVVD